MAQTDFAAWVTSMPLISPPDCNALAQPSLSFFSLVNSSLKSFDLLFCVPAYRTQVLGPSIK